MKDLKVIEALGYWESLSSTPEKPQVDAGHMKRILDAEAASRDAELRIIEAEKKGRMVGLQEGIMIGVKAGKLDATKENARNMLSLNLSIEDIMAITQLTMEEIKELAG